MSEKKEEFVNFIDLDKIVENLYNLFYVYIVSGVEIKFIDKGKVKGRVVKVMYK